MSQNLLTCPWQERRAQRGGKKKKKQLENMWSKTPTNYGCLFTRSTFIHCVRKSSPCEAGKNRPAGENRLLQMSFLPTAHRPVTAIYLYYYAKKKEVGGGGTESAPLTPKNDFNTRSHSVFFSEAATPLAVLSKKTSWNWFSEICSTFRKITR